MFAFVQSAWQAERSVYLPGSINLELESWLNGTHNLTLKDVATLEVALEVDLLGVLGKGQAIPFSEIFSLEVYF